MSQLLCSSADLLGVIGQQGIKLRLSRRTDAHRQLREDMEQCVSQHFSNVYDAHITQFTPLLLGLEMQGEIVAVVGLRPASDEPLFLQQYLDAPIERLISAASTLAASTSDIIEVGNLVSTSPGMARLLIVALTHYLYCSQFKWVAFTGTPILLNSFSRLTLSPVVLADADPVRLGDGASQWGSYYATKPKVMGGYIPEGYRQLRLSDVFARLSYTPLYLSEIETEEANRDCA
ncbi:MAG: thermostable hemolysin [Pseudomonadota bacterium]|nr:thermostable hemolysin [Pseudomonadota bacterium]